MQLSQMKYLAAAFCGGLFLITTSAWAQKPAAAPCGQVSPQVQKELQQRANAECRSIYHCLECSSGGKQTCTPVVVQPNKGSRCGAIVPVSGQKSSAENGAALPVEAGYKLDLLVNWCFNGGVSLEALVIESPYNGPDVNSNYTFQWKVDGVDKGNGAILNCVTGKQAVVTVRQKSTGVSESLSLDISKSIPTPTTSAKLVAAFKRTSCFGRCPAYSLELYDDGTATWNGLLYTSPIGKKTAKAPANALAKLEEQATAGRFFSMNDRYPKDDIVDAPSTVIYLNMNGQAHQVVSILGAPDGFKKLEQIFMDITEELGWAKSGGKPGLGTQKPGLQKQSKN